MKALLPNEVYRFAPNEDISTLDTSQGVAACAITGTDGLVTVSGSAGTGKTTMLRVAFLALGAQPRRMLAVAPTREAASVGSREVGAAASSIHALLADHGFRWGADQAGAMVWTRLRVGEIDPSTGVAYGGQDQYVLRSGDRSVVDEAGMVDLQPANVLADLAIEQGVGLAFVGDPHQALPVGPSGAMVSAVRHANAAVELDTVHRFRDPEYAALMMRLRDTSDARMRWRSLVRWRSTVMSCTARRSTLEPAQALTTTAVVLHQRSRGGGSSPTNPITPVPSK